MSASTSTKPKTTGKAKTKSSLGEEKRPMNLKQEQLMELIKKKKECDKKAHDIVLQLIEKEVTKEFLLSHAQNLGPNHLEDVIEERKLTEICGWALCDNPLPPSTATKPQKYAIRGKRVLDITERKSYCSSQCYAKSTHFKKQLPTSPLWMRDQEVEVVGPHAFHILDDDTELHGLTLNITGLTLNDKDVDEDKDSSSSTDDEEDILQNITKLL